MGISFYISGASAANAAHSQSVSRGWGQRTEASFAGWVWYLALDAHTVAGLSLGAPASHSKLLLDGSFAPGAADTTGAEGRPLSPEGGCPDWLLVPALPGSTAQGHPSHLHLFLRLPVGRSSWQGHLGNAALPPGLWQGGSARHQGLEWMLGELAAGTHGGPFHRPLNLQVHRPCDGASYQQRTCSPPNARMLPQSGGPTPLQPLQEFSPRPGQPQPCWEVLKPSIKIHC